MLRGLSALLSRLRTVFADAGHESRKLARDLLCWNDPQRPSVWNRAGGEGWSTPSLHSWPVQRDGGLTVQFCRRYRKEIFVPASAKSP
jgi:hypothetical protein